MSDHVGFANRMIEVTGFIVRGSATKRRPCWKTVFKVGIARLQKFSLAARHTEGIYDNDSNDKMPELKR